MPLSKAAALVLAITLICSCQNRNTAPVEGQTNLFLELDSVALGTAQAAVQSALENQLAEKAYFWSVPRVAEGSVTPRRTWRSRSGHWCREFEELLKLADGRQYSALGKRCRNKDGRWLIPND